MYGLDTIKRLNAQKSGDFSFKTKGAKYVIAEINGERKTFLGDTELPLDAKIIERVV